MVFAIGEKNFSKINSLPTSTTIEKQASKQASKQLSLFVMALPFMKTTQLPSLVSRLLH